MSLVHESTDSIKSEQNIMPEFNGKDVTRSLINWYGNKIHVTDKDEENGLELFCYNKCTPESDEVVKLSRGIVFNGSELVMRAFPYTQEISEIEVEQIKSIIEPIFDKCRFFNSEEGTLVRLFYYGGKWYISTHRKLNAFKSKWASRESFGYAFKRALEEEYKNNEVLRNSLPKGYDSIITGFQSILDKKKQYMFLVRHTKENRIVCQPPIRPTLFHVGTFIDGHLSFGENVHIPRPTEHKFNNISDLLEHVGYVDVRNLQGIIIFAPNNKQYKILNKIYYELFSARGNEPSIKFRYLQVRLNKRMRDDLFYLYPETIEQMNKYEDTLREISHEIYNNYVKRYIKKMFVTVPQEEYVVIKECHNWHESDRIKNRITQEKVMEVINQQTPTNLNRMIRRFLNEDTTITSDGQFSVREVGENQPPRTSFRGGGGTDFRRGGVRLLPRRTEN